MARSWKDVRAESGLNKDRVAAHQERMLAEVRAHRLAEVRARQELSQVELAERMGVSQARVSAIERGELTATELSTIKKYIAALGGQLKIIADFGDEKLVLG
jgi:DNA-binding XRE family transcriptional regulator